MNKSAELQYYLDKLYSLTVNTGTDNTFNKITGVSGDEEGVYLKKLIEYVLHTINNFTFIKSFDEIGLKPSQLNFDSLTDALPNYSISILSAWTGVVQETSMFPYRTQAILVVKLDNTRTLWIAFSSGGIYITYHEVGETKRFGWRNLISAPITNYPSKTESVVQQPTYNGIDSSKISLYRNQNICTLSGDILTTQQIAPGNFDIITNLPPLFQPLNRIAVYYNTNGNTPHWVQIIVEGNKIRLYNYESNLPNTTRFGISISYPSIELS